MAKITYRELEKIIKEMTEEQKDSHVTVRVDDEFYPAEYNVISENSWESDIIDVDHPFLSLTE